MNNKTMYHQEIRDNDRHCQRDHLYAQQLNNAAASCIESGEHDKAVKFLVKALCISRTNKATLPDAMCYCSTCSLDECIAYSEERAHQNAEVEDHEPKSKRRKIESNTYLPRVADTVDTANEGYTHKRPIMIPPSIITKGHILGPILALIITFNLALANHLKLVDAVASENCETTKSVTMRDRLGKILRLYELAYRWEGELTHRKHCDSSNCTERQQQSPQKEPQQEQEQQQAEQPLPQQCMKHNSCHENKCSSLRFDMIVCNNLSQIHRMAQNYSKQEKCLQHLLSIMMFVVDWQRERANSELDEEEFEEQQQNTPLSEASNDPLAVENDDCDTPPAMPVETEQEQQPQQQQQRRSGKRKRSVTYMDLDGFLRNVSPFLLKDDCAEAA